MKFENGASLDPDGHTLNSPQLRDTYLTRYTCARRLRFCAHRGAAPRLVVLTVVVRVSHTWHASTWASGLSFFQISSSTNVKSSQGKAIANYDSTLIPLDTL